MTDHDFQMQVTGTLGRLETKMDILVGADGTGGWKAEVDQRLDELERQQDRKHGRSRWLGNAITAGIASGLTAVAQRVFHH